MCVWDPPEGGSQAQDPWVQILLNPLGGVSPGKLQSFWAQPSHLQNKSSETNWRPGHSTGEAPALPQDQRHVGSLSHICGGSPGSDPDTPLITPRRKINWRIQGSELPELCGEPLSFIGHWHHP